MTRIDAASDVAMTASLVRAAGDALLAKRQRQREARALPDRAVAADRAVVLADDAVGDRQAEAGAAADRLSW